MAKTQRTDPLRNFKFTVQFIPLDTALTNLLVGVGDLGFAQMGGLSVQNELIAYREGGMNTHPHKMVGSQTSQQCLLHVEPLLIKPNCGTGKSSCTPGLTVVLKVLLAGQMVQQMEQTTVATSLLRFMITRTQ